jgi:3-oxoacyl-[acyl-carrier-protein] synthase-3
MPFIQTLSKYLPERVLTNATLAERLNCDASWIYEVSGIEERRIAEPEDSIASLAEQAAKKSLTQTPNLILLATGTSERRFPGPAAELGERLGLAGIPAIDIPLASAGSLFALALAAQLAPAYGTILVAAAEKMSATAVERNTAILFGDGAGACLVTHDPGPIEILDSVLHSDGTYTPNLRLEFDAPIHMDGRTVIMQASRRIPAGIVEVLAHQQIEPNSVAAFLMHQANQNLIDRVAKAIGVPSGRFFSNIHKYGNTSSASMLIAAAEWWETATLEPGSPICFAGFGAGFHWGALLARKVTL